MPTERMCLAIAGLPFSKVKRLVFTDAENTGVILQCG
jgi:hypothetical protein